MHMITTQGAMLLRAAYCCARRGLYRLLLGLTVVAAPDAVFAQDAAPAADAEAEAAAAAAPLKPQPIYVPLEPAFVVNYGGEGRLRYIKANLTARFSTTEAADAAKLHLPYLRNNLLRLLASQTDETLSSQAGKEALRQQALTEIRQLLKLESGLESGVEDLLFTTFIVQK
jgi:flagellar protein FliL